MISIIAIGLRGFEHIASGIAVAIKVIDVDLHRMYSLRLIHALSNCGCMLTKWCDGSAATKVSELATKQDAKAMRALLYCLYRAARLAPSRVARTSNFLETA